MTNRPRSSPPRRSGSPPVGDALRRIQIACLVVLATVAGGAALHWLRPVMIPFVLAAFFALGLAPLVELQRRRLRMPRSLAILVTLGLGLLVLSGVAVLVSASVRQLAANAAGYQDSVIRLINTAADALPLDQWGLSREVVLQPVSRVPVEYVGGFLMGTTNAVLDVLSRSLLVLVFMVYLLVGMSGRSAEPVGVWREIEHGVQRFLITKAVVSAATGLLVGLVLSLLGVDLALVFGLFAFLLNFIPSIGSVIATLLPLPVVLVSPELSTAVAVAAIAVPGAIQFGIGNVVEPQIMGGSLDLHPVVVLLALILWGMLWGIEGMLLATPITAVVKILSEHLEQTRPLAHLLAGRLSALTARGR